MLRDFLVIIYCVVAFKVIGDILKKVQLLTLEKKRIDLIKEFEIQRKDLSDEILSFRPFYVESPDKSIYFVLSMSRSGLKILNLYNNKEIFYSIDDSKIERLIRALYVDETVKFYKEGAYNLMKERNYKFYAG